MKLVSDMGGFPCTGTAVIARGAGSGDVSLFFRPDYVQASGAATQIILTHVPYISQGNPLFVTKNGSVMFYGVDYTQAGSVLNLTVTASTGDKFFVGYWAQRMQGATTLYVPPATYFGFDTAAQPNWTYSTVNVANDTGTNGFSQWYTSRSLTGHADGSGKWQGEFVANSGGANNLRIFGLIASTSTLGNYIGGGLGDDGGNQNSGGQLFEGVFANPGASGGTNATSPGQAILICADMTARKAWLYLSSANLFIGGGDPTTGSSPTFTWSAARTLHLACAMYSGAACTINTGGGTFINPLVSGYALWG